MKLFGPSRKKEFNAAWADFRTRGTLSTPVPESLRSPSDLVAVVNVAENCPIQPGIRLYLDGPEVAGTNLALPDMGTLPRGTTEQHVLVHRALLVLQTLIGTVGPTRCYGGFWGPPGSHAVAVVLWVEYADARLCVVPQLQWGSIDISFSFSHVVLWRQPWMTVHEHDDFGWADLSTNYQDHIGEGGTYWEVMASWNNGERLWQKTMFGIVFDASRGSPVQVSQKFGSFYHFQVGEDAFRPGSPVGQDLRRIRQAMQGLSQMWSHFGQQFGQHPTAAPDSHKADRIRQRED